MAFKFKVSTAIAVLAGILLAASATAETVSFTADLSGDAITSKTGSKATGQASLTVDAEKQTVTMTLAVKGITIDGLWDQLVAAPIGPIHLHHYATHDHSTGDGVTLVMPVPFGATYAPTPEGFTVTLKNYPYAEGAKLVGTKMTFAQFMSSLEGGDVVLNIHTDAFNQGEISGLVVPAERH